MAKKQTAIATVPKHAEVDAFITEVKKDAEESLAFIEAITITKPADREFASNALSEVAKRHDMVEEKRISWVKPLKSVTADIDATFRPVTKALKAAIDTLKAKIGAWDVAQACERDRLLKASAQAAQTGNMAAAEKVYEQAALFVAPETGASSKIEWTGEVTDAAAIPREYLCPDLTKLEAVTRATGADPGIPGWRAFPAANVRTSRRGVL